MVRVKDVFGGDSGGSFPGCFSVLNSLFQKEVSSAWNTQDTNVPSSSTSGMTIWRFLTMHCLFVSNGLPTFRGWSHHAVRRRVGM